MGVLLTLEEFAFAFQHDDNLNVERHILVGLGAVVGVFDIFACILGIEVGVDVGFNPFSVEVLDASKTARAVHHRHLLAIAVEQQQLANAGFLGHAGVVGTKGGGDMHNAGTVFGGNIVAKDDAESIVARRLHPRNQLLVAQTFEVTAFALANHFERQILVASLEVGETLCLRGVVLFEETAHLRFGHDNAARLCAVGFDGVNQDIVNRRAHAQCRVRWQSPRSGGPCHGVGRQVGFGVLEFEF